LRAYCILNGRSGPTEGPSAEELYSLFAKHGIDAKIHALRDGDSIPALVEKASENGFDTIVAGGGDGTINGVVSAMADNAKFTLGVIPLGTFNHFARDLAIPADLEEAIQVIAAGFAKSIDLGEVNGCVFVNNSSVGLYPELVKLREGLQKSGHSKRWAAIWASLRILLRFRRLNLVLRDPVGTVLGAKTSMLFVGNNAYETNLTALGTRDSLEAGKLWVMMSASSSRLGLLSSLLAMLWSRQGGRETFISDTSAFSASCSRAVLKVAVDGEVLQLKPPLNYRIRTKSLRVIVPVPS
jgi:diacylglycerol kinase family enzyme